AVGGEESQHLEVGAACGQEKWRGTPSPSVSIAVHDLFGHRGVHVRAAVDQLLRELKAAHAARRHGMRKLADIQGAGAYHLMQGRPPLSRSVRVRAAIEEESAELPVRVHGSDDESV